MVVNPNPSHQTPALKISSGRANFQHNSPLSISHSHWISEGQDEAIKRTHELSHGLSQTRKASLSGRCRKPVLGVRIYLQLPVLRPRFERREVEMPTSASHPYQSATRTSWEGDTTRVWACCCLVTPLRELFL